MDLKRNDTSRHNPRTLDLLVRNNEPKKMKLLKQCEHLEYEVVTYCFRDKDSVLHTPEVISAKCTKCGKNSPGVMKIYQEVETKGCRLYGETLAKQKQGV